MTAAPHFLNRSYNFLYRLAAMSIKPVVNAVAYLNRYSRIKEVGRANLYGRRTSHHKLNSVLCRTDAT